MADDGSSAKSETSTTPYNHGQDLIHDADCPFCAITSTYQPISPLDPDNHAWNPDLLSPPTYVLLSTTHAVAFLDIAPLTRGHVLLAPRRHRVKIGDLLPSEAAEIGRMLPLVARAALSASYPDIPHHEVDYNVVQNNGPGAAQVIPHVHFHIIPRPPLDYQPPASNAVTTSNGHYAPAKIPTGLKASFVQFGRGQRNELDDDDALDLVKVMRGRLKEEWQSHFGGRQEPLERKQQKL